MADRFEKYNAAEKLGIRRLRDYLVSVLTPFVRRDVSSDQWTQILAAVYPEVEDARYESARLARDYYDQERAAMLDYPLDDTGARHDVYLAGYTLNTFVEALEPAKQDFLPAELDSRQAAVKVVKVASLAEREVQNGGRSTLISAADSDPECLGWARRAGGATSCAFCTVLISRGPVYRSAEAAGAMFAYHRACDCRIVPVFDRSDWPGRDEYLEAERVYKTAEGSSYQDKLNSIRRDKNGSGSAG